MSREFSIPTHQEFDDYLQRISGMRDRICTVAGTSETDGWEPRPGLELEDAMAVIDQAQSAFDEEAAELSKLVVSKWLHSPRTARAWSALTRRRASKHVSRRERAERMFERASAPTTMSIERKIGMGLSRLELAQLVKSASDPKRTGADRQSAQVGDHQLAESFVIKGKNGGDCEGTADQVPLSTGQAAGRDQDADHTSGTVGRQVGS